MGTDDLLKEFETSLDTGLTTAQAEKLLQQWGPNTLTPPPRMHWFLKLLLSIFGGFFNQLLWVGSILCGIAYGFAPNPDVTNVSHK